MVTKVLLNIAKRLMKIIRTVFIGILRIPNFMFIHLLIQLFLVYPIENLSENQDRVIISRERDYQRCSHFQRDVYHQLIFVESRIN
jgi:hypothetical protein